MKITIKEFAQKLGVSVSTIRRLEQDGLIKSERTNGNHRRYEITEVSKIKKQEKVCIAYARVSTSNKKDDLERQIQVLELFCAAKGFNYNVISDIGSGLNYTKKGLLQLIEMIEDDRVATLVVTHKDRLLRFGAELIFKICQIHGVEVIVINSDEKPDYQNELAKDVLSILTVFSARLYGSRSKKNKKIIEANEKLFLEDEQEGDNSTSDN